MLIERVDTHLRELHPMQQLLPMFHDYLNAQTPELSVIIFSKPILIPAHQIFPPSRKPLLDEVCALRRLVCAVVEDVRDVVVRLCKELPQARAEELVEELVERGCQKAFESWDEVEKSGECRCEGWSYVAWVRLGDCWGGRYIGDEAGCV